MAGRRRCLLTGASGYLGRQIARKLALSDWDVIGLTRDPKPGEISFTLGAPVAADALAGADALIHCAYDFAQVEWPDIHAVNVEGSALLLRAAAEAKVPRILIISTISAFDGCKSLYGRAKLEIERAAAGACVIRPGLIYGDLPGAMFGRLVAQVRASSFVPMPGDGRQMMFTVHQDDLGEAIVRCLGVDVAPRAPVTVAHDSPVAFRDILAAIGRKLGRKVIAIPTPWRLMWLGLRGAELARAPLGLRSDSLVSLVNQNRAPVLNARTMLGVRCREFNLTGVFI